MHEIACKTLQRLDKMKKKEYNRENKNNLRESICRKNIISLRTVVK